MNAQEREDARQAAWRELRPTLARRHAEFRRECEEKGIGHLVLPPLPMTAPEDFRIDTGVPEIIEGKDIAGDPERIELPDGVDAFGRVYAPAPEPSPEEVFSAAAKRSLGERVRSAVKR